MVKTPEELAAEKLAAENLTKGTAVVASTYKPVACKVTFLSKKQTINDDGSISISYGYRLLDVAADANIDLATVSLYGRAENGGKNIFYTSKMVGNGDKEAVMAQSLVFVPNSNGQLRISFAKTQEEKDTEIKIAKKATATYANAAAFGVSKVMVQMQIANKLAEQALNFDL